MFEFLIRNDLMSIFMADGFLVACASFSIFIILVPILTERTIFARSLKLILLMPALFYSFYYASTLNFLEEVKAGKQMELVKVAATSDNVKAGKQDFSMLVYNCLGFNQKTGSFDCNEKTMAALLSNVDSSDIEDMESHIGTWVETGEFPKKDKAKAGKTVIAIGLFELAKFSKDSKENSNIAKERINRIAPHLVEFYEKELVRLVLNDIPRPNGVKREIDIAKDKAFSRIEADCYSLSIESCNVIKKVIKAEASQSA